MTKSRNELIREDQLRQESQRLAGEAIERAAGPVLRQDDNRLGYLVTYFNKRTDVPEFAVLRKMVPEVARNLEASGLHEPISLRALAGKWWVALVDASFEYPNMEPGGCALRKLATSEELIGLYSGYYCEVLAGPFDRPEDSIACFFVNEGDRSYRDPHASYCELPRWIVSRLEKRGMNAPIPFAALAGKYWVCGMSGGVWKTEDIERVLRSGTFSDHITDGPFDSRDDADYAFDVLWESPE